jgi:hypothetical protein
MTTTDSRQLRMLMDGILAHYGIDNLQLSIDLSSAVKRFLASDSPARTREDILKGIQKTLEQGAEMQIRIDAIEAEIKNRVRISPVGREWEDFLRWAYKQEQEKGQKIEKFVDWWVSDEWRMAHPPSSPQSWYVKWLQAFPSEKPREQADTDANGVPMSF